MDSGSKRISITIDHLRHSSPASLSVEDRQLLDLAIAAASRAYAPYSRFMVGAALRMSDSTMFSGNNQENAAFPAGICAERTALHSAMSQWPGGVIEAMAVVVPQLKGDRPVSPCGICRQVLVEQEARQGGPMRLLLGHSDGTILEFESAACLLPLSFNASFL